jgi:hypothetical protein
LESTFTCKYKYDSKSNWIEQIEYEANIAVLITEREIEYYE